MRRLTLALVPLALAACDHEPAGLVMEELRVSMDVVTAQPQPLPTSPVLVLINNSPGHQVDPHVFGGIASYSDFAAGAQIRYYDFATGMDLAIPTSGNRDQLSDVNAGRIVFTRILPSGDESVMLFDATTGSAPVEVNPVSPGSLSWRSAVAIGGNTIAYVDHGLAADTTGEIVLWDLVLGAATRITDDVDFDQAPAVSSDGNVIVWERCSLTNNCDVAMAVRAGGGWTVSDVAATTAPEGFPDVDDGTVTWTEHTGTDYDIFWRAVGGGAVQQLALAGDQIHGAISGDLITFEGLSGGNTDLFAYHMAEGALYQITNTQGVNESLNDVTVLPGGSPSMHTVRVVWQANDGSDGMNNIYGATFTRRGRSDLRPGLTGREPQLAPGHREQPGCQARRGRVRARRGPGREHRHRLQPDGRLHQRGHGPGGQEDQRVSGEPADPGGERHQGSAGMPIGGNAS
jgi:hypothetical protein